MIKILAKIFAVLLFVTLIAAFVSYRSGIISDVMLLSPNGSAIGTTKNDSTARRDTVAKVRMMPSSKVVILADDHFKTKQTDTVKRDSLKFAPKIDSVTLRRMIMGGSKSSRMFDANDTVFRNIIKKEKK